MLKKYLRILTVIFIGVFVSACDEKKSQEKTVEIKKELMEVKIHSVKKQTYPIWVDFTGKTEALKNVNITSRVNGELEKIYFDAGHKVRKNQVLFKIDDTSYKTVLAQKEASLKKDEASLSLANSNVKRYEPLVKKGLAPREKLEELKAKSAELRASVKADKQAVKQANLDLEYTNVKATIDGKIGKSLVDIGNIISSSTSLANIVQTDFLYVNINPSSKEVFLLNQYKSQENPDVLVLPEDIEDKSLALKGKVDFIDNKTNEDTGTVALRAKIDNTKGLLYPGTFVNVKLFITDKIPFIALHPNNILQNQLGSYVYVVDKNNKIKTKQIELDYSNSSLAIVKSGLKDGDKVVVSATNRLSNNLKVKALEVNNPVKK